MPMRLNQHGAYGPYVCQPLPRNRWGEMWLNFLKALDRVGLWWTIGWYYNHRRTRMLKRINETRWVVQEVLAERTHPSLHP